MNESTHQAGRLERLPIRLIMPKQGTERRVSGGGSPPKPFRAVDVRYRRSLGNQVEAIQKAIEPRLPQTNVAPVRVKVIAGAVAKSHRPEKLFSEESCPIIGAGSLGELFVKATDKGLRNLIELIANDNSPQIVKELSSVESIEAVTAVRRRGGQPSEDVLKRSPRKGIGFLTRVRLFGIGTEEEDELLTDELEGLCKVRGIRLDNSGYSPQSRTYAAECRTVDDVDALSRLVGVRSIAPMPLIRIVRPRSLAGQAMPILPTRDDVIGDVPVVVVVDSGISNQIPGLDSWVVGRISDVAPQYRNTDHGTFVAALICWGRELNPALKGNDADPCALFDLQVIPNADPVKGDTDTLSENELLSSLESALQAHANDYKVWNLSLSSDTVCSLDEFSSLAQELDNLQETYQVSFIVCAGNYSTPPLLEYPRPPHQDEPGRITAPADTVLGITVGSISHIDYKTNGPKAHHPSAFSRHGAGPNYIIKPDLVHYGGTCATDLSDIQGIKSLTGSGLAEDLGTSFSTPLVSRTLAQIYHQITPTPTPVLARALLTHHARDPRNGQRIPDGEENYLGFGLPTAPPYCLECSPHMATLVFDDTLRPGHYLEWDRFPYPPSLSRDGRFFGEIWMTLAFAPARGVRWGTEYCETHIGVNFGVYRDRVSRRTGEVTQVFKGLVPPEHRNPGKLHEAYQVEKLRKWAPVRTYHGRLKETGERGHRWRLKLQLLTRHGIDKNPSTLKPQPFSLIVSIADPDNQAPVYDEMVQLVRNRFQSRNLNVRPRARVQPRSWRESLDQGSGEPNA